MKSEHIFHNLSFNLIFLNPSVTDDIRSKTSTQSTFLPIPLNGTKCFSPTKESFLQNQRSFSFNETPPNIGSYHAYFTYLYPKARSFLHILASFYAVFLLSG